MPIRVALNHRTRYRYDRAVTLLPHLVRLRPAPHCRTPILSYSLKVTPEQHFVNWQQDPYNNFQARFVFDKPHRELAIEVDLVVEMTVINPFDFFLEEHAERFPFDYGPTLRKELSPYLELEAAGPRLQALVDEVRQQDLGTVDFLVDVNRRLEQRISYVIRMEPGIQPCETTLDKGRGSCRDTAWLLVQTLRHLGLAARFASGYLIQLAPDVKPLDGPAGPEQDFTDLHAWAEVYLPGAGWVGLDPTSGLLAGEGHIPLACSAEPLSAAPVTGSFSFSGQDADRVEQDFHFEMRLTRVQEDPRVTKPYSDEQWREIQALGRSVDERLRKGDVRLSMGGEPTFVSVDDMDGEEWNLTALGADKRLKAGTLLKRLRRRLAPGGMLHYGQGKQYPAEPLPRWALACIWRKDGAPVWKDDALVADEATDYGHDAETAREFIHRLARRLGLPADHIQPGYEDPFYFAWRERRLPVNVDPHDARLDDPRERERLARIFEAGLDRVVGMALPLTFSEGWRTGPWHLRGSRLYLVPGDSPMGYRLPLDSLPWVADADLPSLEEVDPFEARRPLPRDPRQRTTPAPRVDERRPAAGQSASWIHRTALCVEPRHGRLYVFTPPLPDAESSLDLVAAIEEVAAALETPCLVEGYPPPFDPRLESFSITPDPGVLEVNIHPSVSWDELVGKTEILYEEARQTRLGTEKFMLDGRHSGTGGGNHIILGGPTPEDSPVLRRPDLLRSLVGYQNNHPCLSYLFSGLFIGPTSQAPRFDEARHDSVYEMEIAFDQVPEGDCPPWLVDRIFRNLLVDVTGNTHRAEFCIDKLYSPDGVAGRRGLLEMRSFEMPPHARMSLAQHLLLRGLVAWFWEEPYGRKLVHWGTRLHDRFLLPHFVEQDLGEVIDDLTRAGFPLQRDWFAPHLEFRFPLVGRFCRDGIEVELRNAIEPWHVLGEQSGGGGSVRFVDSSLERLQVKVTGMTGERHHLGCNGRRVPLHPTGTRGEFVAGVRYRAWQPPSCLHPTIGVHAPLVFDLVDEWNGRSVGGCTYHVSHPGGRSYETFPVNANEAQARRVSRFFVMGHSPGPLHTQPARVNPDFPLTLDLRRAP